METRDELNDVGSEAVEPDDPHTYQDGLRGNMNDTVDRMDVPC
jgi:hypothetical protein